MMYRSSVFAILAILGLSADVVLAGKFVGLEVGTRYIRSHWLHPTDSVSVLASLLVSDVTNFETDTGPNENGEQHVAHVNNTI